MLGVPELGCDEDVLALETRDAAVKGLLESSCNLLLVAVDLCEIEMAVAGLESFEDSSLDLARLSLPCAKTQLTVELLAARLVVASFRYSRDGGARVELDGSSERHCEDLMWID